MFRRILRLAMPNALLRKARSNAGSAPTLLTTAAIGSASALIAIGCHPDRPRWPFPTLQILEAAEKFKPAQGDPGTTIPPIFGDRSKRHYNFIADVVEQTAPAVVYIEVTGRLVNIFGEYQDVVIQRGSGFIIDSNGLIITNAHVVANRAQVSVKLNDGRALVGNVEYYDEQADLATIKVNATNLPTLKLGSSSKVRAGEWVVAVGSPLSLTNTITAGVVSSVARASHELGIATGHNYIQTDAAIDQGNSGGPLVNLDCEAIGVNTLKLSQTIAFAIPSDTVQEFLKRAEVAKRSPPVRQPLIPRQQQPLVSPPQTKTRRRYLGVTMISLTPDMINQLANNSNEFQDLTGGILVMRVTPGSPAARSGLQKEDIIVKINDQPADSLARIYELLETERSIEFLIRRGAKAFKVKVVTDEK